MILHIVYINHIIIAYSKVKSKLIYIDIYLILGIYQMDQQKGFNNKINVLKRKNHTIPSKKGAVGKY